MIPSNIDKLNQFLINNEEFLKDKYEKYFARQEENIDTDRIIAYVYDVFSLEKYKSDVNLNEEIKASLLKGIQQYKENNKEKFTNLSAVKILSSCIKQNELFAVHYGPNAKQNKSRDVQINLNRKQFLQQERQTILQNKNQTEVKQQLKVEQREKEIQNDNREERRYELKEQLNFEAQNEFDVSERIKIPLNPQVIKKNAKMVFDLFCKNQMQLGGVSTFERLSSEANTMTIGKLLVYAKAYDLINQRIKREVLMVKFKKVSNGNRHINFEQFYSLLTDLHSLDTAIFERMKLTDDNLFKQLKFVKFPFYTRDQSSREISLKHKFTTKLTSHSGKFQSDLKAEIQQRKSLMQLIPPYTKKNVKVSPQRLNDSSQQYSALTSALRKLAVSEDKAKYQLEDNKVQQNKYIINRLQQRIKEIQSVELHEHNKFLVRAKQRYRQ